MYIRILRCVQIISYTGAAHAVDSSDIAFRMAAIGAMRQGKCGMYAEISCIGNFTNTTTR